MAELRALLARLAAWWRSMSPPAPLCMVCNRPRVADRFGLEHWGCDLIQENEARRLRQAAIDADPSRAPKRLLEEGSDVARR